jgi:hypothetical protein
VHLCGVVDVEKSRVTEEHSENVAETNLHVERPEGVLDAVPLGQRLCMCLCMYVWMYAFLCMYVLKSACVCKHMHRCFKESWHVCMYVCMYQPLHVCMYECITACM